MIPKSEPDPYTVLGVARNATLAEIRAAYHALVAKYHPDKHQGNPLEGLAAEKMAEINRAHEILSDPARRAAYDSGQGAWPRAGASGYPYATAPGSIPRKRMRWLQILGLLLLLPLLFRFGSILVRLLVRLVRATLEITKVVRGTPIAAVLVLAAIAVLAFVLVRRRLAKRKSK
jgi:DnaJ-class molecular chaperone with C-terminal Zn finger domain